MSQSISSFFTSERLQFAYIKLKLYTSPLEDMPAITRLTAMRWDYAANLAITFLINIETDGCKSIRSLTNYQFFAQQ